MIMSSVFTMFCGNNHSHTQVLNQQENLTRVVTNYITKCVRMVAVVCMWCTYALCACAIVVHTRFFVSVCVVGDWGLGMWVCMVHLIFFYICLCIFLCIFWRQKMPRFRRLCVCGVHTRCECVRSLITHVFCACMCRGWLLIRVCMVYLIYLFFYISFCIFFCIFWDRKCQDFGGCVYVVCMRALSVCTRCLHVLFVYVCVVSDW